MVVNFNADTQKVNILQIPRDSYVEDPINVNLSKRINAIYAYAYNQNIYKYGNKTQASHASVEHLESTVESTFGSICWPLSITTPYLSTVKLMSSALV